MPSGAKTARSRFIPNPSADGSRWKGRRPWTGIVFAIVTLGLFIAVPHVLTIKHASVESGGIDPIAKRQMFLRYCLLFFGILPSAFVLQPWLSAITKRLKQRMRFGVTPLVLAVLCLCLSLALVRIGRHQFGGFDYNAMLEVGWRQVLGQRMYVDFLTPTPPGFNLGINYAMSIFGPTWDATLYLNCIFACGTLIWMYWLLRVQEIGAAIAGIVALAIECQTVVLLSFWWYNDTVEVLSAIFLLTCLAYLARPASRAIAASYVVSFALLALMKPNIAGLTLVCGLTLVIFSVPSRTRLGLLTVGAVAILAMIFICNHISLPAMMGSYREAAIERGGFSAVGWLQMRGLDRVTAILGVIVLILPGLCLAPLFRDRVRAKQWKAIGPLLFFPLSLLLAIYGLMSNGEFWQVECAPPVAVLAVFVFSRSFYNYKNWMRRAALAVLCADLVANAYLGAVRYRVYMIGPHKFFEWSDNEHIIPAGPLENMRVSGTMMEVQDQIATAVKSNAGPFFFGPRVDYSYFALGIDSPDHLPAWWHPGTAFGRDQQAGLIQVWKQKRFETLIFLKGDYTFYSPEFLTLINAEYLRDDTYPRLTIYRRRH